MDEHFCPLTPEYHQQGGDLLFKDIFLVI